MDPRALYPTCVLKVNLGCCKACVVNIRKLLSKINGVVAIDVDAENHRVTVCGKVDPETLVKEIGKKKKKAVVLSYEEPKANGLKNGSGKEEKDYQEKSKKKVLWGDSDGGHQCEPYEPPKKDTSACRDPYCKLHKTKTIIPKIKYETLPLPPPPPRYPPPHPYPPYYREELLGYRPPPGQYDPYCHHQRMLPPPLQTQPPQYRNNHGPFL